MVFSCFPFWQQLITRGFANSYKHLRYFPFLNKSRVETYDSHQNSRTDFPVVTSPEQPPKQAYVSTHKIKSRSTWKTYISTAISVRYIFLRFFFYKHIIFNTNNCCITENLRYFAWRRITHSSFPSHILACFDKHIVRLTTIFQSRLYTRS